MPDIRPELIEKAAAALYGYGWETEHFAQRQYHRESAEEVIKAVADDLRAEGAADSREQWARKVAQELATTSVQSAQYIGQMVTGTLDALLAMTRASVLAEAKAEALREAADALDAYDAANPPPDDDHWTCDLGYYGEAAWLRNRADQIAEADQ